MRAYPSVLLVALIAVGCVDNPDAATPNDEVGCTVKAGTFDAGKCQVSCGSSEVRDPATGTCKAVCTIDVEVGRRASGDKTVDCGNLLLSATDSQRETARSCVLEHVASGRPFKLITWMMGEDSQVAYAYVAPGVGVTMTRLAFDSNWSSFSSYGGGAISKQSCGAFRAQPDCQVSASSSCLTCEEESEHTKVCEVPRSAAGR